MEPITKLNPDWIRQTRDYFKEFLALTDFPHPKRNGERGREFLYPEWIIMFIALLSVKCKAKSYLAIHRMATQYWAVIADDVALEPISERQLRDRLKKICHTPGAPASFIFQIFPQAYLD